MKTTQLNFIGFYRSTEQLKLTIQLTSSSGKMALLHFLTSISSDVRKSVDLKTLVVPPSYISLDNKMRQVVINYHQWV